MMWKCYSNWSMRRGRGLGQMQGNDWERMPKKTKCTVAAGLRMKPTYALRGGLKALWGEMRRSSLPLSWQTPGPGSVRGDESRWPCMPYVVCVAGLCWWFKVVRGWVCRSHHPKKHDVSSKKESPFINSHKDHLWILWDKHDVSLEWLLVPELNLGRKGFIFSKTILEPLLAELAGCVDLRVWFLLPT